MLRCFLASNFFLTLMVQGGDDTHTSKEAFKTELFFAFHAGHLMDKADTRLEMKLQSTIFSPSPPYYFHHNLLHL